MADPRNIGTKTTAQRMAELLNTYYAKKTDVVDAIKAVTYGDNTIKFYRTTDTTGTAAFSFDLPEEMYLDQTKTELVDNFTWSEEKYPGSTDPELNGKPVLVMAVKGDDSTTYSFLNMEKLIDKYSAADKSITVNGYTIKVNVSETTGNQLTLKDDGLYVNIRVSSATDGDLAGLDGEGNLTDSGIAAADVQKKLATGSFTSGNIRTSDANGFAQDGGIAAADILTEGDISDYTVDELKTLLGIPTE